YKAILEGIIKTGGSELVPSLQAFIEASCQSITKNEEADSPVDEEEGVIDDESDINNDDTGVGNED
ncbi:hypothetical protein PoB_002686400, partial [Plakobranchus ocellatus]